MFNFIFRMLFTIGIAFLFFLPEIIGILVLGFLIGACFG